jgi:hypothetical protein
MIRATNVTLATVAGVKVDDAQNALQRSMWGMQFDRVLLIASSPPRKLDPRVEYIPIPPLTLAGYNIFMLKDFHRYVETSHTLTVHPDGFVVNPERWDTAWLDLDYIGAPWREQVTVNKRVVPLVNRVGNSGFALRSKRLLDAVAPIDLKTLRFPTFADDLVTCHLLYHYLTDRGLRFADMETAAAFSIEAPDASFGHTLSTAFGFHGRHYLKALLAMEVTRTSKLP